MNQLQKVFNFHGNKIRTALKNDEVWFVAKDVCDILEVGNTSQALVRLDEDEKDLISNDTPSGSQEMAHVNESGLYSLVLSSRKLEAKAFKRWITHEVLPAIRKTGSYSIDNPQQLIALALVEAQKIIEHKDVQIAIMQPKAEFFDAVAESKTAIDFATAAKVLKIKGFGRNNLFDFLRNSDILMSNNQPYQRYIDAGYFRVIEQKYTKPDGSISINIKTLVYQKGLDFIRKTLVNEVSA